MGAVRGLWLSLFLLAACGSNGGDLADEADPSVTQGKAAHAPANSAAAANAAGERPAAASASILAWTKPAAGTTVTAPVDELVFHFSPPARLGEVTVTGPDGAMPMMVTAVGEVEHYSLPLSADTPGSYTVAWRATRQAREYRDSFDFTVR